MSELLHLDRILRKGASESLLNAAGEARPQVDESGSEFLGEAQPAPFVDDLVGEVQKA